MHTQPLPFAPSSTLRSALFGLALMATLLTLGGIDSLAVYASQSETSALMAQATAHVART